MYKLMVIEKDRISYSNHTTRNGFLKQMAHHKLNGRFCFLFDSTCVNDYTIYQQVSNNIDLVNNYHMACKTGDIAGIMKGQAWLNDMWTKQGINPSEILNNFKRLANQDKGKLKF